MDDPVCPDCGQPVETHAMFNPPRCPVVRIALTNSNPSKRRFNSGAEPAVLFQPADRPSSAAPNSTVRILKPKDLYFDVVQYLKEAGWEREEKGSGWWWKPDFQDDLLQMGEALDLQLLADGIDLRVEPS